MFHFAIYKLSYLCESEIGIPWIPVENESDGQKLLNNILSQHDYVCDKMFRTNDNGEILKKYPVYILKQENDITLLQLHNSVMRTLVQHDENSLDPTKYTEIEKESNPYCHVIIDNRKDVGQIAIEISSAWGKPDYVRDVLQVSLTRMIQQLKCANLKVSIIAKMCPTDVWAFVSEQLEKGDSIRRVVFEFLNRKTNQLTDLPKLTRRINNLFSLVESTGAGKGQLKLEPRAGSPIEIKRRNKDLQQIIQLCSNQGYTLAIHFKKFKVYRCNEDVRAVFEMKANLITDFKFSEKESDIEEHNIDTASSDNPEGIYGIIRWLDSVRQKTKEYDNGEKIHSPRKNRHKK